MALELVSGADPYVRAQRRRPRGFGRGGLPVSPGVLSWEVPAPCFCCAVGRGVPALGRGGPCVWPPPVWPAGGFPRPQGGPQVGRKARASLKTRFLEARSSSKGGFGIWLKCRFQPDLKPTLFARVGRVSRWSAGGGQRHGARRPGLRGSGPGRAAVPPSLPLWGPHLPGGVPGRGRGPGGPPDLERWRA